MPEEDAIGSFPGELWTSSSVRNPRVILNKKTGIEDLKMATDPGHLLIV